MTGISRSSYAVDCNRTCPLAQLGPDDIARGSFGMEVCVIGWVASRACYIGVIGLSEGGPATRDLPGTNR